VVVGCNNITEWSRVKYKPRRTELIKLLSFAYWNIIGAMTKTPRATAEVFLKISLLHLKIGP
jgi:hypothetical protein